MPAAVNMEEGSVPEKAKPGPEAAKNEDGPGIVQAVSKTNRLPHKPVGELLNWTRAAGPSGAGS